MIGRLFQVAIPQYVFDGADVIRVIDVHKEQKEDDKEEDLYVVCRVSKNGQFVGEESLLMDSFCDFLSAKILITPEPDVAAKMLLLGNKV